MQRGWGGMPTETRRVRTAYGATSPADSALQRLQPVRSWPQMTAMRRTAVVPAPPVSSTQPRATRDTNLSNRAAAFPPLRRGSEGLQG